MGSNKSKKLKSKLLLTGVVVTMVSVDIVPLFSYAKDFQYVEEIESLEESSPEIEGESSTYEGYPEEGNVEEQVNDEEGSIKGGSEGVSVEESSSEEEEPETKDMGASELGGVEETGEDKANETQEIQPKSSNKRVMMSAMATDKYVLATDADFSGTANGGFRYIGDDDYVEIPHKIKGVNVTSYDNMFREGKVKGVKSTNKNVVSTVDMFRDFKGETLEVSQLDVSSVHDMSYMFSSTIHHQTNLTTLIGMNSFNTSNVTHMNRMFYRSLIRDIDTSSFDTSKVTNMEAMFGETQDIDLDVSSLNTSNVNNMASMFNLAVTRELDVSNFNTSKVTTMSNMFNQSLATNITGLGSFNTSNVTNMNSMFRYAKVQDIDTSSFNTSKVGNMGSMFAGVVDPKMDLTNFDTSRVTTMNSMFSESQTKELNLTSFNTSRVTAMNSMFRGAQANELDLSSFDTTNVTDMIYMFRNTLATKINLSSFNTENVEKMTQMFNNSKVEELDLRGFNTLKVTDMGEMFRDSSVKNLDLSSFSTGRLTDFNNMFNGSKATTIDLSSFDTTYVTNMNSMFKDTSVQHLDLSSFDMVSVNDTEDMFSNAKATTGTARSSSDADKLNESKNKPNTLTFKTRYVLASDEDFSGFYNGIFKYIGDEEYVEIPHKIKGTNITSYKDMFANTKVKGVISTNNKVTDMSGMFKGNMELQLDTRTLTTNNVTNMSGMFEDTKTVKLDLTGFITSNVTTMENMFKNTKVKELDLGSFDLRKATNTSNMFQNTEAKEGYARTQGDLDKINKSTGKPTDLNFTLWGITTSQNVDVWTNQPVEVSITAESGKTGVDYVEMVNETGRNYLLNSSNFSLFYTNNGVTHPMAKGFDSEVGANWMRGRYDPTNVYALSTYINPTFSGGRGTLYSEDLYPLPDTITYSLSVMSPEPMHVTFNGTDAGDVGVRLEPNKWTRITRTIVKPDSVRPASLRVDIDPSIPLDTKLYYKDYKIEKGDTATPWKPAPEDSESSSDKKDSFKVYSNGTYIFRATDTGGNTRTVSHTVSNIDTTQPTAELKKSHEGWTSQDVTIYVEAEDDLSGVDYITLPNGEKVTGNSVEYPVTDNGKYTFKVTDKAGNGSYYTEEVTNIDKSVPKLGAKVLNTNWTKGRVNVVVFSESSASGLKDIKMVNSPMTGVNLLTGTNFKGNVGDELPEGWIGGRGDNGRGTGITELVKSPWDTGGDLAYHIKVENDRFYLVHNKVIEVTPGDKLTVSLNTTSDKVTTWDKFYNEKGELIEYHASRGFKHYSGDTYYYTLTVPENAKTFIIERVGIGTPQRTTGEATFGNIKLEIGDKPTPWTESPEDAELSNNKKEYQVDTNGIYTYKATYNNGTTSETSVNVTNIDRTSPDVKVSGNVEDWVEEDNLTLTINAEDKQSGVKSITLPDGKVVNGNKTTFKVTKNGNYTFVLEDNVGNKTTHVEKVEYLMIPYSFYIYGEDGKPIEGVEFELLRNREYYKTGISDSKGLVTFGMVPPDGSYQIRQVTAPGGVIVDPKDIETGEFTEPVEVVTYPRGDIFPSTGTFGLLGYIGATLLMAFGALVITKRKRTMKKDK